MAKSTGTIRAEVIHRMSQAIAAGKTATKFLSEMQSAGLGYRRTTFLADWRAEAGIEKQADAIKYVRKGYVPTTAIAEAAEWKLSKEYMYKMQVATRLQPGEPITTRFVNIMTDQPITIGEAEERVAEIWAEGEGYIREEITGIIPIAVIRKVT